MQSSSRAGTHHRPSRRRGDEATRRSAGGGHETEIRGNSKISSRQHSGERDGGATCRRGTWEPQAERRAGATRKFESHARPEERGTRETWGIATGTPEGGSAGETQRERQPGRRIREAGQPGERIVGDTEGIRRRGNSQPGQSAPPKDEDAGQPGFLSRRSRRRGRRGNPRPSSEAKREQENGVTRRLANGNAEQSEIRGNPNARDRHSERIDAAGQPAVRSPEEPDGGAVGGNSETQTGPGGKARVQGQP